MNDKRLQKTYNTAIFVAFGIGFLFHAAIIFAGGIGWSQITEDGQKLNDRISQDGKDLRDRIAALEKVVIASWKFNHEIIYHISCNVVWCLI